MMYTARFATIRNINVFLPTLCSWAQDELEHRRRPSIIIGVCTATFKDILSAIASHSKFDLNHGKQPGCHDEQNWNSLGGAHDVCNQGEDAEEEEAQVVKEVQSKETSVLMKNQIPADKD